MPLALDFLLHHRYRIVEVLGQGGMGAVYRAWDERLGVEVAIKENFFSTEAYARQFRREANILAQTRHPGLPRVTDHFEEGDSQYIVMDYIAGEDLRQRVDRSGPIPEGDALVIGISICDALKYLHSLQPQVVHRDIKPGNVRVTPQGRLYLVDFGLAKVIVSDEVTTTGARAMTPGYSPPEQYGTSRTDHRSDIYSLGATLYAVLSGYIPEDGLARAMGQVQLTPLRKRNPKVSRQLATVIEKSLAIRPEDRYQDAESFGKVLLEIYYSANYQKGDLTVSLLPTFGDRGAVTYPGELSQPLVKPLTRRRWFWTRIALILLLLGLVVAGWVYLSFPGLFSAGQPVVSPSLTPQRGNPTLAHTPTVTETSQGVVVINIANRTETPSGKLTLTATLPQSSAQTSPAVTTPTLMATSSATLSIATPLPMPVIIGGGTGEIAFASRRSGRPQIWLINVDGSALRQITDLPDGACQPSWSPDGKYLAFVSPCPDHRDYYLGSFIYRALIDGGELEQLTRGSFGDYDPAWSPQGYTITYTSLGKTGKPQVYWLNLETANMQVLTTEGSQNRQPAWSPDGSQIVFITNRLGGGIWMMNIDGSNQRAFSSPGSNFSHPLWSPDGRWIVYTSWSEKNLPSLYYTPSRHFDSRPLVSKTLPMNNASFSPDGLWLAYESWPGGENHDIWIIKFDGSEMWPLLEDAHYDFQPAWRPSSP